MGNALKSFSLSTGIPTSQLSPDQTYLIKIATVSIPTTSDLILSLEFIFGRSDESIWPAGMIATDVDKLEFVLRRYNVLFLLQNVDHPSNKYEKYQNHSPLCVSSKCELDVLSTDSLAVSVFSI
jgi:hypothetical protein